MSQYYVMKISNNIRELIQAKRYEPIICQIMNDSKVLFKSNYVCVENQSHGECDFIDVHSKEKFDAKLLFSKEQCHYLSKGLRAFYQWFSSLCAEIEEASSTMLNPCVYDISKTKLYNELKSRLNAVQPDETPILFIPFPIIPDCGCTYHAQFGTNIVMFSYDKITSDNSNVYHKNAFLIYPSQYQQRLVILDLDSGIKEYFDLKYIKEFVNFEIQEHDEDADILLL